MKLARAAYRGGVHLARIEGDDARLLFGVGELISHLSRQMTLEPGELTNPVRGR